MAAVVSYFVIFFGFIAWVLAWLVSATFNASFGFTVSHGLGALLYAALFLCLDVAKGRIQITIHEQEAAGGSADGIRVYSFFLIIFSIYIATSSQMQIREYGVSKNVYDLERREDTRGELSAIKSQLRRIGDVRSPAEIRLDIDSHINSPNSRWTHTNQCRDATISISYRFCKKYRNLKAELLRSQKADMLRQKMSAAQQKRESIGAVADVDPLGTKIARWLAGPAGNQKDMRLTWSFIIALFGSLLIEVWAGRGLTWALIKSDSAGIVLPGFGGGHGVDMTKAEQKKLIKSDNFKATAESIDSFFSESSGQVKMLPLNGKEDIDKYQQATVPFSDLYAKYETFCAGKGREAIGKQRFSEIAQKRSYYTTKNHGGTAFAVGVTLR